MVKQEEVDTVAAFVEATEEMRSGPFFGEDEPMALKASGTEGGTLYSAEFGLPEHLKSALIPFRRLWMHEEPCNFRNVCNILYKDCKYDPTRQFISYIRDQWKRSLKEWVHLPLGSWIDLRPGEVVDIWLNTQAFHVGKKPRKGRYSRDDFERYRRKLGDARFEFLFRTLVDWFGHLFFSLLPVTRIALRYWAEHEGLSPTNEIRMPFGPIGNQTAEDGSQVVRDRLGWSPSSETLDQRLVRLLRRSTFSELSRFLKMLEPNQLDSLRQVVLSPSHVANSESISELVALFGYELETTADIPVESIDMALTGAFDIETGQMGSARRCLSGQVLVTPEFLPIMNRRFVALKQLLLS